MATGVSKLLEEMTERLLVCQNCQEDFQSPQRLPRVLPCHHAFCDQCLQQLTKSRSFRCPLCRRSFTGEGKYPVDTTRMTILDLTKVMGSQEGPECQGCSKGTKASSKCLECEDLLCEDCCQAHKTVKISSGHSLVSLAEAASNPEKLLILTEKCSEHTEKNLEFFCPGCQMAACSSCFVLLHSGHKMVALEAVLEQKRKELTGVCGRLEKAIPNYQGRVDLSASNLKAMDTHHSKTSDKVRALFSKVRKLLDVREGEILADLAAKVKEDRQGLEEQQAKDDSLLSEAQASLQFGQRLASLGLPSQLLSGPEDLTRTCDDLESRGADPAVPVPTYQVDNSKLNRLADMVKMMGNVSTKSSGRKPQQKEQSNRSRMEVARDVDTSQGCLICIDKDFDQPVKLNDCNHVFCKACIEQWFQNKPTCPTCYKIYDIITGTMPPGTMNVSRDRYTRLAGFDNCGCIVINYSFDDGVQKTEHPNPGQPYRGARRTAYLPDNAEGNKVLRLLREAWDRKLTFTIGHSITTGHENVVTWNDIDHKTSPVPGHSSGYPDPDYLTRVQEQLAAQGVTEESIMLARSGNLQDFSQFYTPLRLQIEKRLQTLIRSRVPWL